MQPSTVVGGTILANILASVSCRGAVVACGLRRGQRPRTTVFPFILRNVALLGVDSVQCPEGGARGGVASWPRSWGGDSKELDFATETNLEGLEALGRRNPGRQGPRTHYRHALVSFTHLQWRFRHAYRQHSATMIVQALHAIMRTSQLATLITADGGVIAATPLPLLLDADEGPEGVLCGHVARANPFWKARAAGDALAIFLGPDAYVSPSWYANKPTDGRVVPTYNYGTVHASGPIEFFEDAERLRSVVTRLTDLCETPGQHHGRSPMRRPHSLIPSCVGSSACACQSRGSSGSES